MVKKMEEFQKKLQEWGHVTPLEPERLTVPWEERINQNIADIGLMYGRHLPTALFPPKVVLDSEVILSFADTQGETFENAISLISPKDIKRIYFSGLEGYDFLTLALIGT